MIEDHEPIKMDKILKTLVGFNRQTKPESSGICKLNRCWILGDENSRRLFAAVDLTIQMHQLEAFKLGKSTWIIKEQVMG
jgi:hypothetical protein